MNDDRIAYVDTSGMTANVITGAHTEITNKGVTIPMPDDVDKMLYEMLEKYSMAVQMAVQKHDPADVDHARFADLQGDYEYAASRFLRILFGHISRMVFGVSAIGFSAGVATGLLIAWLL
jgi:hypothetical protein